MATVVPTVLARDPREYADMLRRAEALSRRVHIDIEDGRFTDATTISLAQVQPTEAFKVDLHLMVRDPAQQLHTALSLKPHLIIFHAESVGDVASYLTHAQELGIKAGVAILPETSLNQARTLIERADHVLIFTGTLGHNGGRFHADVLPRIEEVKRMNRQLEVSVDGGITEKTAAAAANAGADVLYVGGFLQDAEDPQAALAAIQQSLGVQA